MYYIVFVILVFFSVIEILKRRSSLFWFNVSYLLMMFMAMFRYGQLTDYPSYEYLYQHPDQILQDPLFSTIEVGCSELGLDFVGFVIVVESVIMLLAYPFLKNQCSNSIFSLLVFYCYSFLILPMSAMRQGLCLSMLLFSYDLLVRKKYLWFYIISFIGIFIHVSMLIVFVLGFTFRKHIYNSNMIIWIIVAFTLVAVFTPDLSSYIPSSLSDRSMGEKGEGKVVQLLLRLSLIIPLLIIKPSYGTDGYFSKGICIVGYCLYCLFIFAPTVAGRMEFYFRTFWCLFGAYVIFKVKKTYLYNLLLIFVILIHSILFFKNINSFIVQGDYNEKVSLYNFPYISIFDQDELENYKK